MAVGRFKHTCLQSNYLVDFSETILNIHFKKIGDKKLTGLISTARIASFRF